jgi:hypothetical protein
MPSETSTPGDTDAGNISERLTAALAATWRAIQHHHPDIPPVILTLGADTPSQCGLGHFARNRWHHDQDAEDAELHELLISGEGLHTGAEGVLATLLHHAAHALATARGITDTSNRGYYHNKRYKALAEELGLTVTDAGPRGWQNTTLPPATAHTYTPQLHQLTTALTIYPHTQTPTTTTTAKSRNKIAAVCQCPRRIWAARTTLAQAPILCTQCGTPFTTEQGDTNDQK